MKNFKTFITLILLLSVTIIPSTVVAQSTGQITGIITDEANGASLVGVNVFVGGTTRGAATDLDGNYTIKGIPEGTYTLRISSIGYSPKTITNVSVKASSPVVLNVMLAEQSFNVKEVVISADEIHSTESAILSQRKRASTISDGISSEQIKRSPDATSGDALKRVAGLSIVDNKFVYIRGITDRYNGTTLDGATVTSTEVGKKSFSFDLVPANLIENISVVKSATPDLPGDFSGGLVQLNTLDFPSKRSLKVNLGQSYNSNTTSKDIMLSSAGSSDWLGLDDGTRGYPGDQPNQNDIARNAKNTWGPRTTSAPFNGSLSLAYGNRIEFSEDANSNQLGFISAFSYKNSYQNNEDVINDAALSRYNTGSRFEHSVLWGALANMSYKFSGLHKISFKNNYDHSGEDALTRYNSIDYTDSTAMMNNQYTIMNWTQRSTYTGQLTGDHTLQSFGSTAIQWHASVSSSRRDDPDRKEATYYRSLSPPVQPFGAAVNKRSWAFLNERSFSFGGNVTIPVASVKMKFGATTESHKENYRIRYFNITPDYSGGITDSMTRLPLDQIYSPENFGRGKFLFSESSKPTDSYIGEKNISALYAMVDMPFELLANKFRFVGGARLENANQQVLVPRTLNPDGPVMTTNKHNADVLPSLNLTYLLSEKINIRLAYSNSVNRPELRELAPTSFYDFVKYEDVGGNMDLRRAFVKNYDIRAEFFPNIGELVAMSGFLKNITDAIEEKLEQSSTRSRSWFNSGRTINYGWELELRKSLDFIGGYASNFSVTGNYTRVFSNVEVTQIDPRSNSIDTRMITYNRPMQGQSPYTVNLSISFTEPSLMTSVNLLFNRFGRRLNTVGFLTSDIYEEPGEVVDVTITQPIANMVEAKFTAKNLTNKNRILTRDDILYELSSLGRTYSLQFSFNL